MKAPLLAATLVFALAQAAPACTLDLSIEQNVVPVATLILASPDSSRSSAINGSPDRAHPAGIIHAYSAAVLASGPPGSTRGPTTWTPAGDGVTICNLQGTLDVAGGDWWCEVEHAASGDYTAVFKIKSAFFIDGAKVDECEVQQTFSYRYDSEAPTLRWSPDPGGKVVSSSDVFRVAAEDETVLQQLEVHSSAGSFLGQDDNASSIVAGPVGQNLFRYHTLAGAKSSTVTVSLAGLRGTVTAEAKATDYGTMRRPDGAYDWHTTSDARSFTVDADPPKVRILALGSPDEQGHLSPISGTASDDVAVAEVTISVKDLATGKWWDGSTFTASGAPIKQVVHGPGGQSVDWSYAGLAAAVLPKQGAVWLVAVEAVDMVGRTGEAKGLISILPTGLLRQRQGYVADQSCQAAGRPTTDPLWGEAGLMLIPFILPAGSPELALALSHSVKGPSDSVWGRGWTSPHDQALRLKSGDAILWTDGNGTQKHYFPPATGDVYTAPPQSFTQLTVTERDSNGHPVRAELKEKDGTVTAFQLAGGTYTLRPTVLADRNGLHINYTRDTDGRLTRAQDSHGRYLQLTYGTDGRVSRVDDSASRSVTYVYDANGNKTSEAAPNGTTGFVYDAQGRLTRMNYPNGGFRALSYGADGKVRSEESDSAQETLTYDYFPSSTVVTDALNRKTVYEFATLNGLRRTTRIIDPDGKEVSFAYDANMNLIRQVDSRTGAARTTEYTYDAQGNVTGVKDPANGQTGVAYDPVFNQPTSITDPNGNPATTLGYNGANGDLTSVVSVVAGRQLTTSLGYDGLGHVTSITDPKSKTTTFEYDNNGQLTRVQDPVHPATLLARDAAGRVTSQKDPKTGLLTTFAYDPDGSLTDVTDALNGVTHYEYTSGREARLLAKVTDARQRALGSGLGTQFGYDTLARLTSVTAPNSPARTFTYNDDGTLKRAVNARGQAADLSYDGKGRLTSKTTPEGTWQYGYDDANRQTLIVTPDGSRIERTFDTLDRLLSSVQTYPDGYSATLTYDYDANGNKKHTHTPWGTFSYDYDEMNRMKLLTDPEGKAFSFIYDDAGRRSSIIRSIGLDTRYDYDDAGQLTIMRHTRNSDQVVLSSAGYEYDAAGNRTKMIDPQGTHEYTYDDLHRLTRAQHPSASALQNQVETFDYDGVGNRTADQGVTGYQYDAANRITENSLYTFQHDSDGNVSRRTAKVGPEDVPLSYDSQNQLKRVDLPDGSHADFAYDGLGRRLEKDLTSTQGTQKQRYVYDGEDILAILGPNSGNSLLALFTHGPGIDEPLKMNGPNGELFFLTDGSGSIVALMGANNDIVERVEYQAYGTPTFIDVRTQTPGYSNRSWTASPFAFAGGVWDFEFESYLHQHRMYVPLLGSYASTDPYFSINPYAYALNNPIRATDPGGEEAQTISFLTLFSIATLAAANLPDLPGREQCSIGPQSFDVNTSLGTVTGAPRRLDILFGQKGIGRRFSDKDETPRHLRNRLLTDVVEDLKKGTLRPDQVPVRFIAKNNERIAIDNRSLYVVYEAGLNPIGIDVTGDSDAERQLAKRLLEMGGSPSTSIHIRQGGK